MYRGLTTFKYTKCGKKFKAPYFELAAMVYTMPHPYPHCSSIRTRLARAFPFSLLGNLIYHSIWEGIEKNHKNSK